MHSSTLTALNSFTLSPSPSFTCYFIYICVLHSTPHPFIVVLLCSSFTFTPNLFPFSCLIIICPFRHNPLPLIPPFCLKIAVLGGGGMICRIKMIIQPWTTTFPQSPCTHHSSDRQKQNTGARPYPNLISIIPSLVSSCPLMEHPETGQRWNKREIDFQVEWDVLLEII